MADFSFDQTKLQDKHAPLWRNVELIDSFELIDHQEYPLTISHDSLFLSIIRAQMDKKQSR
ncbi:hypothetical protein RR47_GL000537 [Enterococcus columbae DSM 7374 = ATCC 51263]|nr:hypothetical protein RR47_GL000537 [Enterococcus columbae DSM 7374 = ATCC 51263]